MATDLGTTIKRARERKRWTQQQLATAVGVSQKTVDNWENGRTSPRSSLGAVEEVLGVSVNGAPRPADSIAQLAEDVASSRDLTERQKRTLLDLIQRDRDS